MKRWIRHEELFKLVPSDSNSYARDQHGNWYFWDETGSEACGPYDTKEDARRALKLYADNL